MASEVLSRYCDLREDVSHQGAIRKLSAETTIDADTLDRVLKRAAGVEHLDWHKLRNDGGMRARAPRVRKRSEAPPASSPPATAPPSAIPAPEPVLGAIAQALTRAGMELDIPAPVECGLSTCSKVMPPGRTYCTAKHGRLAKKERHLKRQLANRTGAPA